MPVDLAQALASVNKKKRGLLSIGVAQPAPGINLIEMAQANRERPVAGPTKMDVYKEYIRAKEGSPILKARKPTDSEDSWTVGFGHTTGVKEGMEITEEEAGRFLHEDTAIRLVELKKDIPNFDNLPLSVQIPLMYSKFRGSLGQSPKTRKLINKGKFKEAAKEFLDNDEYRGAQEEGSKRKGIIKNDFHALRDALLKLSNGQ